MGNPYLIPALTFGPAIVQSIVERTGHDVYDEHRDDARFSFREAIAHLADWEPILLERMMSCVQDCGCVIVGYDETQRAVEQDYLSSDPSNAVQRWIAARSGTVEFLKALSSDDWEKWGMHQERGRQTVYDQANMTVCHDTYHIEHLMRFLR